MIQRFLSLWLLMTVFVVGISNAQDPLPLQAPLLALNTVERDSILLYDVTTETTRRLSFGTGDHFVWDFSPDGCRVLLTLWQGTQPGRLISADLTGDDVRQMVAFDELPPERWGVWEPDWSPTGTTDERIAFTMMRNPPADDSDMYQHHIAYVTPTNPTPQFYSVTGREHSPQWSADGQWLAYISYDERVAGAGTFATAVPTPEPLPGQTPEAPLLLDEADMWVVSADSETKYRATNFQTGSVTQPRWSPDGELISFVYSPTPNNDMMWMIGSQEGSSPTQLMNEWALVLDNTWLPDGTQILASMRDFREVDPNTLWRVPLVGMADDGGEIYLDNLDLQSADYPRFSADGQWLATRTAYALALVNLESQEMRLLPDEFRDNSPPVWSPAGFTGEAACRQ